MINARAQSTDVEIIARTLQFSVPAENVQFDQFGEIAGAVTGAASVMVR